MQWIEVDENAHLRRDSDYVSVLVQSIRVDWLDAETSKRRKDFAQISPAGDVDSHNFVCSWCAQAHVSIHSCDFTNGYFRGQEIDLILLHRIPAGGIPGGGIN